MKRAGIWVAAALVAVTWVGCTKQPEAPSGTPAGANPPKGASEAEVGGKKVSEAKPGDNMAADSGDASGYVQVKLSVPNMT